MTTTTNAPPATFAWDTTGQRVHVLHLERPLCEMATIAHERMVEAVDVEDLCTDCIGAAAVYRWLKNGAIGGKVTDERTY